MRRPGLAGVLVGALSAAVAVAVELSVQGIPGRSNGGGYVEAFAIPAAGSTAIAAVLAVQLYRGRAPAGLAVGWFAVACAFLVLLMFVALLSNSGLGS